MDLHPTCILLPLYPHGYHASLGHASSWDLDSVSKESSFINLRGWLDLPVQWLWGLLFLKQTLHSANDPSHPWFREINYGSQSLSEWIHQGKGKMIPPEMGILNCSNSLFPLFQPCFKISIMQKIPPMNLCMHLFIKHLFKEY